MVTLVNREPAATRRELYLEKTTTALYSIKWTLPIKRDPDGDARQKTGGQIHNPKLLIQRVHLRTIQRGKGVPLRRRGRRRRVS